MVLLYIWSDKDLKESSVKSYETKPLFTDSQVEDQGITPGESDPGDLTPVGQVSHASESRSTPG